MIGMFSKLRVLILGGVHAGLNFLSRRNSIVVVEQRLRDLEAARRSLEGELAEQRFVLNKSKTELSAMLDKETTLSNTIKTIGEKTAETRAYAADLIALRKRIAFVRASLEGLQATVNKLEVLAKQINDKEAELKLDLDRLRALATMTRAKMSAAEIIENVGQVAGVDGSIDNLADQLGRQDARADAAFNRVVSAATSTKDDEVDAVLADLFNRGGQAQGSRLI